MRSPEEEVRITELRTCGKTDLASHYRNISGYVGSPIPPERWSRDDLVNEIIRAEFAPSPTGAVTNPVPRAGAGTARQCAAPAPRKKVQS